MTTYILRGASLLALLVLGVAGAAAQQQQQQEKDKQQQQQQQSTQFGVAQQPSTQLGAGPAPPTPEETAAIQTMNETSDPQQRLALVEEFLAKYPESALQGRAYAAAAEAYRMQNNFAKAIESGEQALQAFPRDAISMILVADSLAESSRPNQPDYQERLAKAEDYAQRALGILPEWFAGLTRRPEVPEEQYKERERYVEAQVHAVLGYVYLQKAQFAQAEEELKKAIEMAQSRPNAFDYLRLGAAQLVQKKYDEAGASLQRCVELGGGVAETCQQRLARVQALQKAQSAQPPTEKKP